MKTTDTIGLFAYGKELSFDGYERKAITFELDNSYSAFAFVNSERIEWRNIDYNGRVTHACLFSKKGKMVKLIDFPVYRVIQPMDTLVFMEGSISIAVY
jgi:hypothetical protein